MDLYSTINSSFINTKSVFEFTPTESSISLLTVAEFEFVEKKTQLVSQVFNTLTTSLER